MTDVSPLFMCLCFHVYSWPLKLVYGIFSAGGTLSSLSTCVQICRPLYFCLMALCLAQEDHETPFLLSHPSLQYSVAETCWFGFVSAFSFLFTQNIFFCTEPNSFLELLHERGALWFTALQAWPGGYVWVTCRSVTLCRVQRDSLESGLFEAQQLVAQLQAKQKQQEEEARRAQLAHQALQGAPSAAPYPFFHC